jgi:hypothetical protein
MQHLISDGKKLDVTSKTEHRYRITSFFRLQNKYSESSEIPFVSIMNPSIENN